jgi:hypothetical protein
MKALGLKWISLCVLAVALGSAPFANAAGPAQGDTSGPAVGTLTTPSTAVQKQVTGPNNGSTSAGAPGVAGKPGAESGDKPTGSTASGQSKTR